MVFGIKTKNRYLIIAGILNLMTFFLHLIGGQVDLVNPMMETSLSLEKSTQLVGAWHMVTIILLAYFSPFKYSLLFNPIIVRAPMGRKNIHWGANSP